MLQWAPKGDSLCYAANTQSAPAIVADGAGGAIVSWTDLRADGTNGDIYGQRVSAGGATSWTADGIALCVSPNAQTASTIVADGTGGAIAAWQDTRAEASGDIYATRVRSNGLVTGVPSIAGAEEPGPRAWPNPFSRSVAIAFTLSSRASVCLEVYDVMGRRVWSSERRALEAGRNMLTWDGRTASGVQAQGAIYFLRVRGPGTGIIASRTVVRTR